MFILESPHRGDSNEYTQYTIFNMNKKNTLNYPKSAALGFFSKGLKNEFETAVVNEPLVFEPLKFYCIMIRTSYITGEEPSTSVEKDHLPEHLLHQYRDPLQVNPEVSQCEEHKI